MLLVACFNIFTNAYYAAFGIYQEFGFVLADQLLETLFLLDILFSFCTEYLDEETLYVVRDFKKIAKRYMLKSFIFDLLAWVPFDLLSDSDPESSDIRLLRLLKLLRIPRLA